MSLRSEQATELFDGYERTLRFRGLLHGREPIVSALRSSQPRQGLEINDKER